MTKMRRVPHNLYSIVGEAIDGVKQQKDMQSQSGMVKTIVNCIYTGCVDLSLLTKRLHDVDVDVVTAVMHRYVVVCGESLGHALPQLFGCCCKGQAAPGPLLTHPGVRHNPLIPEREGTARIVGMCLLQRCRGCACL